MVLTRRFVFSFFGSRRYFYWFNLVALGFIPFPKEMLALMHNAGMGGVTPKRCCDRIEVDRIFVTPLVVTQVPVRTFSERSREHVNAHRCMSHKAMSSMMARDLSLSRRSVLLRTDHR